MEHFEFNLCHSDKLWTEKMWCEDRYKTCFEIISLSDTYVTPGEIGILEDLSSKRKTYSIYGWCTFTERKKPKRLEEKELFEMACERISKNKGITYNYYISPDKQNFYDRPLYSNIALIYRALTETQLSQDKIDYAERVYTTLQVNDLFTVYLSQLAIKVASQKLPDKTSKNTKKTNTKGGKKHVRKN